MNILFICTHNRCRSILAEAVFRQQADINGSPLIVRSAGSQPAGVVHAESLAALERHNISRKGLNSQSWNEFEQWPCNLAITVCNSAAQESCPSWLQQGENLHWSLQDPSSLPGDQNTREAAFDTLVETLQKAAEQFTDRLRQDGPEAAIDSLQQFGATLSTKPSH
ncbi:arsenate reductase ArsC [Pseudoteredinibacter isoporae]|uniref:Arsenate reductase n=1 Tax=Pseudoteredinibacter isoporae TaxID=570281 RepID=A0A7X0JTR7_9GAMM|nr:arsenate reductase ArsC [Pseudoteredinibacter isoporae]MBB6521684.1 arsenate reductase [Pseudoteredinibacter isoporae]NHO87232.1 arsenate reductase ArsC [Pseudoteredinibacter isoporae]NIB23136.1 arsenate reductase ArsC [Pseudoteredinibacter isoporae]